MDEHPDGDVDAQGCGWGALLILLGVKQWVFTLSTMAVIEEAQPGMTTGVGLYLLFTLATQLPVAPPILAFAVAPQKSAKPLAAQGWLQRHNRTIVMIVSLIFGAFFLYSGVVSLLAFRAI